MEHTLEANRIVYTLKRYMIKMIEDCSTTECRSALLLANEKMVNSLRLLGFEDKSCIELYFNQEEK